MPATVVPFLMFQGQCEEAMRFYVGLLPGAEILELVPSPTGKVQMGRFQIGGQVVRCTDSPVTHAFTFTPASSLFVTCESEAQLRELAENLGAGGKVLMPIANYGFSPLFTWVDDRFGVSWQLNLPR